MTTTLEAIYEKGSLRLKRPLALSEGQQVRVTLTVDNSQAISPHHDAEYTLLSSEECLGRIWNDPAEDEAWAHL